MASTDSSPIRQIAYWGVSAAAIVLVLLDMFVVRDAEWTTVLVLILIGAGMFLRPGGVWRR